MKAVRLLSRQGIVLLLGLFSAVGLTNCGACKQPSPVPSELDVSNLGKLPEGFEFGPADTRFQQFAGEMDVKNVYASTVMLALTDPQALPDCSGLLLNPRLVITAASCVCAVKVDVSSGAHEGTRADASSCVKRVFVTTVIYGETGDAKFKELTTETEFHTIQGSVRPHPALELVLDRRGFVVTARADLAVIQLDEPLEEGEPEVHLAHDEARRGETLVMAGFGHDAILSGVYGARYFRKNPVVDVQSAKGGRLLYKQQGPFTYNGYDGGPCFREEAARRWLVGIASARADQELSCTSTLVYRDWIEGQLEEARKRESR